MTTKTKKPKKPPLVYPPLPCGAVLMALDISSSATGIAVGEITETGVEVHSFGVVRPPSSWSFERKIDFKIAELERLIAFHRVTCIAMELQDHRSTNKRVQGLAVLGRAQGAIWGILRSRIPIDCVPVRDATKLNGKNAKKETRCEWVKTQVPAYAAKVAADPKFDKGMDCADALGLLLYRAKQGI